MATNKDKDKEQEAQAAATTPTPDPVEEAKQEAQAILDAAKAEAEKIKQEAQEKAEEEAKAAFDAAKAEIAAQAAAAAAAEQTAAPAKAEEDMVPVYLFKDNGKYKDDVFVAVNGKSYQIKRGEKVMVPAFVAEVLDQSMSQDQATANLIARQSEEYAAEAARLGV